MIFGPLSTTTYAVNGVSFDMVRLPPGRFVDGNGDLLREVLVSRPFEIGIKPVSQTLWRAVMGEVLVDLSGPDFPVWNISHDNVQEFLVRLSVFGLTGFRLPTDSEWAWVARCGASTGWAGADRAESVAVANADQAEPSARRKVNAAGTFDLSGNLWEWAADWRQRFSGSGIDLKGPESGISRSIRGGCWAYASAHARVTARSGLDPNLSNRLIGVRLLRSTS
jgi:formylglycine-generating enzyme required for sulfatase activity